MDVFCNDFLANSRFSGKQHSRILRSNLCSKIENWDRIGTLTYDISHSRSVKELLLIAWNHFLGQSFLFLKRDNLRNIAHVGYNGNDFIVVVKNGISCDKHIFSGNQFFSCGNGFLRSNYISGDMNFHYSGLDKIIHVFTDIFRSLVTVFVCFIDIDSDTVFIGYIDAIIGIFQNR